MPLIVIVLFGIFVFVQMSVFVLKEYERGVVFFLGRYSGTRGPGLVFIVPFLEKLVKVDQRLVTMDIPTQDVITRDNISIKVNAVVYFRVLEPDKAIIQVENFLYAAGQLAQTTLRSVCGEVELDDLLGKRDEINNKIQESIDYQTDPWGIKVTTVALKHIDLPQEMQRAMAKQAEAERERRAKIIQAEGEYQAASRLTDAASIMAKESISVQLRYLETLRYIATEQNSTILFPVPMDVFEVFREKMKKSD